MTGSSLTGYDLQTRKLVASWPIAGASAIAYDTDGDKLYVGTDAGQLLALDTTLFDSDPGGGPYELPFQPEAVTTLDGPISRPRDVRQRPERRRRPARRHGHDRGPGLGDGDRHRRSSRAPST